MILKFLKLKRKNIFDFVEIKENDFDIVEIKENEL